jgi:hypothetical protein
MQRVAVADRVPREARVAVCVCWLCMREACCRCHAPLHGVGAACLPPSGPGSVPRHDVIAIPTYGWRAGGARPQMHATHAGIMSAAQRTRRPPKSTDARQAAVLLLHHRPRHAALPPPSGLQRASLQPPRECHHAPIDPALSMPPCVITQLI